MMVEYGIIVSKSAEFLTGIFGQMHNLLDAIPFGPQAAIGAGIAMVFYLLLRKR